MDAFGASDAARAPGAAPWQDLKDVVADALELPAAERDVFLRRRCADAPDLHVKATALLVAAASTADFLATPASRPVALAPLACGERCGPYVIEQWIGEGGFSEVYRARQTEPIERAVALKVLKPGMDSRAVLARFALERRTLARLEHPGIARILDAGATASGRPFVVVEFIDGTTLQQFVATNGPALEQRLDLFLQVCDAVAHAHQRGVIHRDLKPSNVLIVRAAEPPRAVVIDFGIAKVLDDERAEFTQQGQFLGTPAYCSPEQQQGDVDDVDTRSDVYALGVLLGELVTGARLAPGVATVPRTVPRELGWIAAMATAPAREHRYASVADLAADVRAFLAVGMLRAGPPTVRYRVATFARRHRGLLLAVTLVTVALLGGGIASVIGYRRAAAARDDAETARREADATADYLTRLLAAADPARQGRDVKVVDLLAASGNLLQQAAKQPEVAARLHRAVGNAYMTLGEYAKAEPHLRAAADGYAALHGDLDWRAITSAYDLAAGLQRAGQADAAAVLANGIAARAVATRGEQHPLAHRLTDMRAKLAFDRGRPAEAEAPLRQLLALERANGNIDGEIAVAGNLAQVLLGLRKTDEARRLAAHGRELALRHHGLDHPLALGTARKLAAVHLQAGAFEAMVDLIAPSLEPARLRLGPEHPDTLGLLSYFALALQRLGRLDEAVPLFRELMAAQQRKLERLHPQAIMTLHNFGNLLETRGDFAAAEPLLRDAAGRWAELRGVDDAEARRARFSLVRAVAAQGRHREIAADFAAAVAEQLRTGAANDPRLTRVRRDWLEHLQGLARQQQEHGEHPAAIESWTKVQQLATELAQPAVRQLADDELAKLRRP